MRSCARGARIFSCWCDVLPSAQPLQLGRLTVVVTVSCVPGATCVRGIEPPVAHDQRHGLAVGVVRGRADERAAERLDVDLREAAAGVRHEARVAHQQHGDYESGDREDGEQQQAGEHADTAAAPPTRGDLHTTAGNRS